MRPKPLHLDSRNAYAFQDQSVVDHYPYRPPYPAGVFDLLRTLIGDAPPTVLDIGCGTGDVARNLVSENVRVDAVDVSLPMIEKGKTQPGGDHPNLRWIHSAVESASFDTPYGLITAGESLHWMDWEVVFSLLKKMLTTGGKLALITRSWGTGLPEEGEIYARYSTIQDWQPTDLATELERRGLFQINGKQSFCADWQQSIDEYIASRHSRAMFSHERMTRESIAEFHNALRDFLDRLCDAGEIEVKNERLRIRVRASVCWGEAVAPS